MAIVGQVVSLNTTTPTLIAEASVYRPMTVFLGASSSAYLVGDQTNLSGGTGYGPGDLPSSGSGHGPLTLQPGDSLYGLSTSITFNLAVLTTGG